MKMTAFWNIAPCSLVQVDVSEVRTAFIITEMMMDAVRTYETSVNFYENGAISREVVIFAHGIVTFFQGPASSQKFSLTYLV
jgi:hypothetical protein